MSKQVQGPGGIQRQSPWSVGQDGKAHPKAILIVSYHFILCILQMHVNYQDHYFRMPQLL